jgi:hypothetical protein
MTCIFLLSAVPKSLSCRAITPASRYPPALCGCCCQWGLLVLVENSYCGIYHHESCKMPHLTLPLRFKVPLGAKRAEYSSTLPQAYDADMEPSSEMLVDPDDYVTEQPENEKDEVAIINPEQLQNDVDMPDRIRADDCVSPPQAHADCRPDQLHR